MSLVLGPAYAVPQADGLFSSVEAVSARQQTTQAMTVDGDVVRSRTVAVDLGMLMRVRRSVEESSGRPTALLMNLFDDTGFEAIIESTAPTFSGGYSLSGRVAGDPLGRVNLVVNGKTVAGSVRTRSGVYSVLGVGNGRFAITELVPASSPEECAGGVEAPEEPLR